jgi:uncharacterized membrane protein
MNNNAGRLQIVPPTPLTWFAVAASASAIAFSAAFLLSCYASLPPLLPVHFMRNGFPNGWQFKTYARVLVPVFIQFALVLTLGAVGALLLSRPHGADDEHAPDVKAASAATEGVSLIALIWIAFQAYATYALARMWQRERAGLGAAYLYLEVAGVLLTIGVAARTHVRLGRPAPRPFEPQHWRYGRLYRNPDDPALFVPTRDGSRWTLNFGRPVAAALIGLVLGIGVVGPTMILALLLR